jgi:carbonic anhydrase
MSIYGGERMWCQACGTVTASGDCDCTRMGTGTQNLVNYADTLQQDLQEVMKINNELREIALAAREHVPPELVNRIDAAVSPS